MSRQMNRDASQQVTLVEILQLTRPFEEFAALVRGATARLEREGVRALVAMNFYTDADAREVGVVITFEDSNHFMEHANMVSAWPEFQQFASCIRLVDMRVHGRLTAQAETWIKQFNGPLRKFERHVAGFVR